MAKRAENVVADIRDQIDALKREREEVQAKPAATGDVEAGIDAFIARQAEAYRQRFPVERLKLRGDLESLGEHDDAFHCFYFGDQIKAALMAEAADGISTDDRTAELRRIDDALLAAEREEEQAIHAAEQRGHHIIRRVDADPRAVLEFD